MMWIVKIHTILEQQQCVPFFFLPKLSTTDFFFFAHLNSNLCPSHGRTKKIN